LKSLGRAFAEHFAVFDRKSSKFDESEAGRNFGDSDDLTVRRQKRSSRLSQSQQAQMSMRRQTVNLVECLAERSLAYGQGAAKGSNVKRLIWFGESQRLGPINEIAAGPTGWPAGHFRHRSDPAMDSHRKPPRPEPGETASARKRHHITASVRYCPLGQILA